MRERVEQFWGDFFGVAPVELSRPGVRVVPHRGLGDYHGAWIFWREAAIILSTPPDFVEATRAAVATASASPQEPERLTGLFATCSERCIGPAYQGYLDPDQFRPHAAAQARNIPSNSPLLGHLQAACHPEEWSHAGIEPERPEPCFGCQIGGQLVAVAQNSYWSEAVVSPGLIVHPSFRGRGCGKAVLAAAAADALGQSHLVLYQTLLTNTPAVRTAEALGFRHFATHLAIRFRG